MRLYLDANVIVYLVEGSQGLRQVVLSWVDQAEAQADGLLMTSYLRRSSAVSSHFERRTWTVWLDSMVSSSVIAF